MSFRFGLRFLLCFCFCFVFLSLAGWSSMLRCTLRGDNMEGGTTPTFPKKNSFHIEIKNMFHNKRYGNLAVDSAAKFFSWEIWQLIQLPIFFFILGGPGPSGPRRHPQNEKKQKKQISLRLLHKKSGLRLRTFFPKVLNFWKKKTKFKNVS